MHKLLHLQVAMGFKVANENMCRPIRALTQMRGYDAAVHALACFGRAGHHCTCQIYVMWGLQVAMGFIKVANETMCRLIRALTQMKGYDAAAHALACFGGAGGQHACAIARSLGMQTIFIHRYSGILSAVGIGLADVVAEEQVSYCCLLVLCLWAVPSLCV